eukprot:2728278-Pyramimonas_sp.AAC.1
MRSAPSTANNIASPGRNLAGMPDAKLGPVPVGLRWVDEPCGAPVGESLLIAVTPTVVALALGLD